MCMSEYVHMRGNNKRPPQTVETNNNTITYRCLGPPTPSTLWSPGTHKKIVENTGTSFCSGSALVCFECMGLKRPKMASGRPKMAARGLPETPKTAPEGCKRSLRRAPRGKKQWFP